MISSLTLQHLINHASQVAETPLEKELLARLEKLEALEPVAHYLDTIEALGDEFGPIMQKLGHYDITTAAELEEKIDCANDFYDIASDAGDVVLRLSDLLAKTL